MSDLQANNKYPEFKNHLTGMEYTLYFMLIVSQQILFIFYSVNVGKILDNTIVTKMQFKHKIVFVVNC